MSRPGLLFELQALRHLQTASNLTMLGRTLVRQNRFDEAVEYLQRALAVQESVFGNVHPAVASAVNELGSVALQRNRLDDAPAAFTRMAEIYRQVFPGKHFRIGVAVSNLGSVYTVRKEDARAEGLYREAVAIFAETQSPTHVNVGIARLTESEPELLAGMTRSADVVALRPYLPSPARLRCTNTPDSGR